MKIYSTGRYVFHAEAAPLRYLRRLGEYLWGVTVSRQRTNRSTPRLLALVEGDVFDVGGYNDVLKRAHTRGRVWNVDVTPGSGVDRVVDLERMPEVATGSMGGVFCLSVLEHTRNPQAAIAEIHRVLRPGGIAQISVPWMFEEHMGPRDYLRFSRHVCELYLSGFEVIEVDYTNSWWGAVAHLLQHRWYTRLTLGVLFAAVDGLCQPDPHWSTTMSYAVRKPAGGAAGA
jgi:SAM-dependent methyltransferase